MGIQNICAVHAQLKLEGYDAQVCQDTVQHMAEHLTLPSRKFAQVMGVGDSLSALHEYCEQEQQLPQSQPVAAVVPVVAAAPQDTTSFVAPQVVASVATPVA